PTEGIEQSDFLSMGYQSIVLGVRNMNIGLYIKIK
ncbi:MAG: hypothetical protein ACI9C4_001689, partial [Paraglaciecola sp.]